MFESIVGQGLAKDLMAARLRSRSMTLPFLFFGPPRVGRRSLARLVARALNCRAEEFNDTCGCDRCFSFLTGDFLDYRELNFSSPVSIDAVRDFVKFFGFKAREGGWKVGFVLGADLMPPKSQDVLLKFLEEPPGRTFLVLLAERLGLVGSTTRSRCQAVPFSFLSITELRALAGDRAEIELHAMAGSLRPEIAGAELHYLRRVLAPGDNAPGLDNIDKQKLMLELEATMARLSYVFVGQGNVVKLGYQTFGHLDGGVALGLVKAMETGMEYLKVGVKPVIVLGAVEGLMRKAMRER
jgi:hypothetical protein